MRRHVVVTFVVVPVLRVAIRRQSLQHGFDIVADIAICIFSDNQRCAGMLNEQIAQPNLNAALCDDLINVVSNIIRTATAGFVGNCVLISYIGDSIAIKKWDKYC